MSSINVVKYLGKRSEDEDDYEYYIEINEQKIVVFNDWGSPYLLNPGGLYPVEFSFFYNDDSKTEINDTSRYGFEKIRDIGYEYYIYGKFYDGKLDLGNGFIIDEGKDEEYDNYFEGHFIKMKVDRIDMRFLSYDEFNSDSKPEPYKFGSLEL